VETKNRRGWLIVVVMFLCLFFVYGSSFASVGVFFKPLIQEFGWSHAQVSLLPTATLIGSTALAPLVGWFLDRIAAQLIVVTGAIVAGCGFLLASQIHSLPILIIAGFLIGAGMAASTQLPAALLITNWFTQRRGVALAVTLCGATAGGAVLTPFLAFVVRRAGWRLAYMTIAAPILLLVVPLVLIVVRTEAGSQSAGSNKGGALQQPAAVEGLEIREAIHGRSFWLIVIGNIFYATVAGAVAIHMIPLLTNRGWTTQKAALWVSVTMTLGVSGKLVLGKVADWINVRFALSTAFAIMAIGCLLLTQAFGTSSVAIAILLYGLTFASPFSLLPMLEAEVFGARHYATLVGIVIMFGAIGGAVGPVLAGRSFDRSGSYTAIFLAFVPLLLFASFVPYACVDFNSEPALVRGIAKSTSTAP
jgi:MFS family permease